jgi:DNA polymerase-3 subunit gamma/tau
VIVASLVPERVSLTLYRKHRPKGFGELVGQPAVVTGLKAAVKNSRVAHAYLFAGPRGTGKTSAARILAKCLNCQHGGPRPDPCGECDACVAIAAGTAFDVVEIDAASNRGINEIRELRERVKFAPSQFRTKVYIVDEVHMLTPEAFNALLKTLEEPPENVVFVLATTEPNKVPQTILSRCQRYEFRRVQPHDIERRLEEVASAEHIAVAPGTLRRIAFLADGALRDALVLLEQARGFAGNGAIDNAVLDAAFGAPMYDLVEKAAAAVAAADARAVLETIASAIDRGTDPAWLAKELLRWFRLALLAQVSPEVLSAEVSPEAAQRITAKASGLPRSRILATLRSLSETISQRYSAQPRIDLELALLRVVLPSDELTLQALSDRLRALEERAGGGPNGGSPAPKMMPETVPSRRPKKTADSRAHAQAQGMQPASDPPAADGVNTNEALTRAKLHALWPQVKSAVKERSKPCFGQLEHAVIVEANAQLVTLGVGSRFNRDMLAEPAMASVVAASIAELCGARPAVECIVVPELGAKQPRPPEPSAFALAESVLGADLI